MMKKLIYLLIFILFTIGCDRDEDIAPQQEIVNHVVLDKKTKEIKNTADVNEVTETSVTVNENSELGNLEVGQIILSGKTAKYPDGFARKITSISKVNGKLVLQTEQATITETFKELEVKTPIKIDNSKAPILPQSKLNTTGLGAKNSNFDKLKFKYNHTTNKYEYEVVFKKKASSNLKGKLSFKGSLKIENTGSKFIYNVRPSTEKVFFLQNGMKITYENQVKATGSLEKKYKTFELAKLPLTMQLPTAFIVNAYLVLRIGASGKISAELSVTSTNSFEYDYSLGYTKDNGWKTLGYSKYDSNTDLEGNLELELKAYFEPGIKIVFTQFRGINAGIYIENYLKYKAEVNYPKIDWNLGYGIKAKAEAKVRDFTGSLINTDFEEIFWEKPYTQLTSGTIDIPEKTYNGDVVLKTQQQVDDFGAQKYTKINGNLKISNSGVYNLSNLECITSITKNLDVEYTQITNLQGFSNLINIGGELRIFNNDDLTDFTHLEKLKSIGEMKIYGNDKITNLQGLSNIKDINSNVYIGDNNSLTSLQGFPTVNSIKGTLFITNNDVLVNLSGLSSINTVGDDLKISFHDNLKTLNGLQNLSKIEGRVIIDYNDNLDDFCALSKLININFNNYYKVDNNKYNPTKQDIINGNCKQ